MNAFELLKEDHKKVSTLFKEIESASGQGKTELFDQLKSELDLHANIEETIFYPALENTEEARDITLEAYEEHKVVKDLLAELEGSAPSEEWDAKLTVLRENVEHHVEEEEGELFAKARQALSETEIEEIGNQIAAAKGEAPPPVAETTRSIGKSRKSASGSKKSGKRSGLLGTLANMVGLGGGSRSAKSGSRKASSSRGGSKSSRGGTTKTASKAASKSSKKAGGKAAVKKSSTKTGGTKKVAKKSAAKKAAKKTLRGGKRAAVRTRSSASKRSGGTKAGSKSRKSGGSKKR